MKPDLKSRHRWLGITQVLLSGVCFSFLGIFGRWAFQQGFTVGELLFWRFAFAGLLLFLWLLNFNPKLLFLARKQIWTSMGLGIFGYAIFSSLYFEAIKGVSVALAVMLLFTFPIFVSLGEHFLIKDRLSLPQWLSLAIALAGLTILLWGDLIVHSISAVICGLGAAVAYSIYVLVSGRLQKNVEPLSSSLYVILSSAMALYVYHHPPLSRLTAMNSRQLLLLFGIAIVSSIAPLTLFLAGLQKMKSSQASILVMIEPVMASIAAWLVLGETLSPRQIFGGAIVLMGLGLNALSKGQQT